MQRWRQRAGELKVQDRIIFQGQVTPQKVREFLHEGTVGVLPLTKDLISASFTSPLKLFEYMAAGIPIVASDLPSMREILNPGINAVLVKPDDPEALALGIRALLADRKLADQLSRQASADAAQYSWMNRGKRIISFLRTVKGESGTSWS
jgi:glycosyltransferase involved in cell wall biosynthesis